MRGAERGIWKWPVAHQAIESISLSIFQRGCNHIFIFPIQATTTASLLLHVTCTFTLDRTMGEPASFPIHFSHSSMCPFPFAPFLWTRKECVADFFFQGKLQYNLRSGGGLLWGNRRGKVSPPEFCWPALKYCDFCTSCHFETDCGHQAAILLVVPKVLDKY